MAAEQQLGGMNGDRIFLGTDLTRTFHVLDIDANEDGSVAKDITGKTITFDVRAKNSSATPLLTINASIVGTFNATAADNTQRARVALTDEDLSPATFGANGGTFRYSLKDMTDGAETILAFGAIVIQRATQV